MPLMFVSFEEKLIPFGFFNIKTDLMIMQKYFFWCKSFCKMISEIVRVPFDKDFSFVLPAWELVKFDNLGDLHGAISGKNHSGILGEIYLRWPFPKNKEEFYQNALCFETEYDVQRIVENFCYYRGVEIRINFYKGFFYFGKIIFDITWMRALIEYIWRGGYPGWLNFQRPGYVVAESESFRRSVNPFFQNIFFDFKTIGY